MYFSDTTEYAIRVLVFMARDTSAKVTVRQLHEVLGLPQKYLGALMSRLSARGILHSRRGIGGGFLLAVDPTALTLFAIVEAVQDTSMFHTCLLGLDYCSDEHPCALHSLLEPQRTAFTALLEQTTLANLVKNPDLRIGLLPV